MLLALTIACVVTILYQIVGSCLWEVELAFMLRVALTFQ